jgi:hypothetical protein
VEQSLFLEAEVAQLVRGFGSFLEPEFSLPLTRCHYWTISWIDWIQSTPLSPVSLASVWVLTFRLHLDFPSDPLCFRFPTKVLYAFFVSSMPAATCQCYPSLSKCIKYYVEFILTDYWQTKCRRVIPEKLIVKSPAFMEFEDSLQYSQETAPWFLPRASQIQSTH